MQEGFGSGLAPELLRSFDSIVEFLFRRFHDADGDRETLLAAARVVHVLLVSFSAVVATSANSPAQLTSDEGIHGMGEVVLKRKPELIRLQVNLLTGPSAVSRETASLN